MSDSSPLPSFVAIVVAAGKGLRAGQSLPKQFVRWRGKPVVRHSVEALLTAGAARVIVVIPEGADDNARDALAGLSPVELVTGGATRQASVRRALEALEPAAPNIVLIHDAARPALARPVIARLLDALERHRGAIPVLPVVDSLAIDDRGRMGGAAERANLRRVQTPQAFHYRDILAAHRAWRGEATAGDDAQVLRAAGGTVALVDGDEALRKLTFAEDFLSDLRSPRTGMGFDVHRLADGEQLWLAGVLVPHDKGLAGHSDADVALHALVDALLGAIGEGDIGVHFPPSDPQWEGAPSARFVEHAVSLVDSAGYAVANVDLTLICEAPKIGPHRDAMRARIAELLAIEIGAVSVKATTTEGLGLTGRGEGIAAQAIATLVGKD
ncbi:bifunctional 2-C-methyl-D-erythritol 4-phosphate cytidylyltransferase/2-C-methyl-D-erythritol 2,4-cyclodiphosphate synthase [Pelagerythrobacter rhizovicinus]|uniref:Bifunctional enzyme IspD/IspF n=1 Tax=Pelagerythrobacter rhizovicinus TaxID=2268576 RepID=A0A4Q2KP23_9SPHN|nr:bifunctional 2-C-methyl-D-erythritol 4-phosphate cytidylyltransferase/2-C-methyl-D-erythritol 2,4-cyclodiphosphate synthase [Pelagerythrobacter rhizovicinus]RXZ66090.1 bifunctional 2-C-methyl-D-erythritol 4-phosphate cytidylyltransferase/2-C-methyl-D-erythritol 2,4-cyclodiphosphate synthase [Pelagerythrobacter rhizovicinus]